MATVAQWIAGARPRTLPAAAAPVLAAVGVGWLQGLGGAQASGASVLAQWERDFVPGAAGTISDFILRSLCALVVALALQVGVNYANDYSDGVRGTDADRVGPARLVGQHLSSPKRVKLAAFASFALAGVAGLALVLLSQAWWLLLVGVLAVVAAWGYTGGKNPYGYRGLGEVFVFIFFGLVAVLGTTYTLSGTITWLALVAAVSVGLLSCALLVGNNLRDIPGDTAMGKRTLAVRLGPARTRTFFIVLVYVPLLLALAILLGGGIGLGGAGALWGMPEVGFTLATTWPTLAGAAVIAILPLGQAVKVIRSGVHGTALIPVLGLVGTGLLVYGFLFGLGAIVTARLAGLS